MATLAMLGAASLSSSNHLPPIVGSELLNPVASPSGRVIFFTKPMAAASPPPVKQVGRLQTTSKKGNHRALGQSFCRYPKGPKRHRAADK